MRNIVRQPVRGEDFFERPKLIKKIKKDLEAKIPIFISGPIRSGKTSTLLFLRDKLKDHYNFVYINAGSTKDKDVYYEKIFAELKGEDIPHPIVKALSFKLTKPQDDIIKLLTKYEGEKPHVIMIDDFSSVLENIYKNVGTDMAVNFLEIDREFRSRIETSISNVILIYTSSIDVETIADKLNTRQFISDLSSFNLLPLSCEDAEKFIQALTENTNFDLESAQVQYLCKKIQWLNPYLIQLLFYELDFIVMDKDLTEITTSTIDESLERVLQHRDYFDKFYLHLQAFLDQQEYEFVKNVLNILSQQAQITLGRIKEIAETYGIEKQYKLIIQSLVNDGYIKKDKNNYHFNSPLLKAWWNEQVAQKTGKILAEEKKEVRKEFKNFKVQRVKIQHIKCFEDVEIKFDPSGNTGLIIGTNGKGKSTILQLISLGLRGVSNVPFTYSWKEVVKKNHERGSFEIDGLYDNNPIHLKFEIDGKDDSITCNEGSDQLKSLRDTFMLLAYGVNRSYKLEETKPYKDIEPIATLFGENGYLKHIKISTTYEYVKQNFETIQALVNKVLEKADGEDKVILTHYDSTSFYFKTPSNPKDAIPIEALSEGFKSTLVWLFDAIIRIVERGGSLENAADVTGIILLDEIDLHLHPSWQRTILESVETLFPNIQFIVTSHSPFVVQSAKKECLIALETEKDSGNVVAVDKDITSELSYSAIVDELFNISFPFSREIEQEMDKFREMANALRDNKPIDEKKFKKLVLEIASKGVELEGIMRRELMTLKRRTGKTFDLWKK
jgi:predicted ATP-binding protein involved in virulence